MIKFLGEYNLTLDAKGRFLFPAGFKKQMPENSSTQFVITIGLNGCLALHPITNWETKYDKISELDEFNPNVAHFQRKFLRGANFVDMDAAGRINIPNNLKLQAKLDKEIVVTGRGKLLEIWDVNVYEKYFEQHEDIDIATMATIAMPPNADAPKNGNDNK